MDWRKVGAKLVPLRSDGGCLSISQNDSEKLPARCIAAAWCSSNLLLESLALFTRRPGPGVRRAVGTTPLCISSSHTTGAFDPFRGHGCAAAAVFFRPGHPVLCSAYRRGRFVVTSVLVELFPR